MSAYTFMATVSIIITVILLVLLMGEVMIRLLKLVSEKKHDSSSVRFDESAGETFLDAYEDVTEARRMPPWKETSVEYNTYLGFVPAPSFTADGYRTNRYGFRYDVDFPAAKEAGEMRVFVVGGSKPWGAGVTQEKLYTNLMEKLFRKSYPESHIRVICAACSAYCTTQDRIMVENIILPLSPDYIIMFGGRNDCYFGYIGRDIMLDQDYFQYRKLIHPHAFKGGPPRYDDYSFKLHFLLKRLIYQAGNNRREGDEAAGHVELEPQSVAESRVIRYLLTNINIVGDIAARHGFKLIFYLEPSIFTTAKRLTPWERSVVARAEKKYPNFPQYNRDIYTALREILPLEAERNGYLYIDGDDAIKNEEQSVFSDNVHYGDRGNHLTARHMFDELQKLIDARRVKK